MFQLILGISLGAILLFVLLLLITEVAATYPIWKHFDNRSPTSQDSPRGLDGKRNNIALWLLLLIVLLIISLSAYFLSIERGKQQMPETKLEKQAPPTNVYSKQLAGSDAGRRFFFSLQTKWEDGKMYGNNAVTFHQDTLLGFSECRYHLLDRDGFLISEIVFSPNDFVYTTGAEGKVNGLSGRFNIEIGLQEYQKVQKLQVVLDKRLFVP